MRGIESKVMGMLNATITYTGVNGTAVLQGQYTVVKRHNCALKEKI